MCSQKAAQGELLPLPRLQEDQILIKGELKGLSEGKPPQMISTQHTDPTGDPKELPSPGSKVFPLVAGCASTWFL